MKVTVVSNDAGGSELVSSYVHKYGPDCVFSLTGPAIKIFERKLGKISILPLDIALSQGNWLLCGTSWQSDIEWNAIKTAKRTGKRSVAFLDHWGNYRERFVRKGITCLPDEIWVGDYQAKDLAKRVLPEVPVRLIENPYFEDLKREISEIPRTRIPERDELSVLFVSEPLREHGLRRFGNERRWGYFEEEGLHYFLSNLHVLGRPVGRIAIRPHPSEPPEKYDWVKQRYELPIADGGCKSLLEEVVESDIVAGFQSMAMVVGLLAGKRVISCIPPGGKACGLPQPEIEHLQLLVQIGAEAGTFMRTE